MNLTGIYQRIIFHLHVIDASGLVVASGFIDLQVHGVTKQDQEYKIHDGVTTALEFRWRHQPPPVYYQIRSVNHVCRTELFLLNVFGFRTQDLFKMMKLP